MKKIYFSFVFLLFLVFHNGFNKSFAAENITIYKNIFSRKISVSSLKQLIITQESTGSLKKIINLTGQNEEEIINYLNQDFELPIVITSKLINSKIGNIILSRVTKIIHVNNIFTEDINKSAIRAGVINGIAKGNGKINLITFLESYPNKDIAINYSALSKVINKVESMSDLVEFFTGSPLEKLKSNPS